MASLAKAANCIGLSGSISIVEDFYGYRTGAPAQLSLLTQVQLLQGQHIHLNLIRTAVFDDVHQKQIDLALQTMRDIYATVTLGVGRILRFVVPPGHEVIDVGDGYHDLENEFSVPNTGLDVFLVRSIVGDPSGISTRDGSCDKDDRNDSGLAVGVEDSGADAIVFVIAHEVGHYLRLKHVGDPNNLMFPTVPNGGQLSGGQGGEMKLHCSMRAGCPT